MSTIAGIANTTRQSDVITMLRKTAHRGEQSQKMIKKNGFILQSSWHNCEKREELSSMKEHFVWDGIPPKNIAPESLAKWPRPFALAAVRPDGLFMARDVLGVKPLYYGESKGDLCFASEVKALLTLTNDINEFPPGHCYTQELGFQPFSEISTDVLVNDDPETIVAELRRRLERAISRNVMSDTMGIWLSGGVDSSVIATLAKKYVNKLHSFVIGLEGATDIACGAQVAESLGIQHHSLTVTLAELLPILPAAIYALESFDALLVRSSVTNYLISKTVSDYVETIFSGEGGDELFAGYAYMKQIPAEKLPEALEDAVGALHNTAFQRVDRSACAQGILPYLPFADMDVVNYAFSIPVKYKIFRQGQKNIEKWVLRKTIEGLIPDSILWRPKTKFWQGTGLKELLGDHAAREISDSDFLRERKLPNGWRINTKEELFYYRIFKEQFGELRQLDWMGRTKGAPVQ